MDDLLKEAIADAKAVRETALENAKMALEEAFTPKLKSMLAQKIQAEIEDEGENHDEVEDEGYGGEGMDDEEHEPGHEDEVQDEVADEVHDDEIADEKEKHDEIADEEEEEKMDEVEDEVEDEVHDDEMKSEVEDEVEDDEKMDEVEDEEDDMEEELDLESILAELEAEIKEEEDKEEEMDETVDENDVSSDIGKSDNKVNPKANDSSETGAQGPEGEGKDEPAGKELDDHEVVKEGEEKDEEEMDEEIDLEEVLKALSEEEEEDETKDEVATLQAEVKEHRDVVKYLREKLNEVNLLNAKLLFSNKLFRAFGLSNEQKLKVVETFDRTKNLREIKLVYSTLAESFRGVKAAPVQESKGSSSKPVASTKPAKEEVISEGAELKARFKKLANIL